MPNNGETSGFAEAVMPALDRALQVSGAAIAGLYPYDEDRDQFYAPVSAGLPVGDPVRALPDLNEQIRHFRSDEAEGKIPEDLSPANYGTSAWLVARRTPLVSEDAIHDADSSFVRRHHIRAVIGVPLLIGSRLVGLLYFDYVHDGQTRVDVSSPDLMDRVREQADRMALVVDETRSRLDCETVAALARLAAQVTTEPDESSRETRAARLLHTLLESAGIEAGALYARSGNRFQLVTQEGVPGLVTRVPDMPASGAESPAGDPRLGAVLDEAGLHVVEVLPTGDKAGLLLLADRDALTLLRQVPEHSLLRRAGGDLLITAHNADALHETAGETSRTLSAVTRLSTRLLKPGAGEAETMAAAIAALTDPTLPELNFDHAAIYLLGKRETGPLMVTRSVADSGKDLAGSISLPSDSREVGPKDVLAYVSAQNRVLIVGPTNAADDGLVMGYPEEEMERLSVPVVGDDGNAQVHVHAIRLRGAADRAALSNTSDGQTAYRPTDDLSLDAQIFEEHRHAEFLRVFVPFGRRDGHAVGVLEAGFESRSHARLERVQIEALRASAATIASAIEAARLHEDLVGRAEQLQIVNEVSSAIATSIDLEQTLSLVARNMARAVDTSICLIALLDQDGSAWHGAAASDMEDVWLHRRVERPEKSIVFDAADLGRPIVVENAQDHELVSPYMARLLRIRSLVALPLQTPEGPIGAVVLGQRDHQRSFSHDEVARAMGLTNQAAVAIRNARLHSREEEEQHIQKDVLLIGFGQWGQKAYKHLVLLKNFFNFRTHVLEHDGPGRREKLAGLVEMVQSNGDLFYWDSEESPSLPGLAAELEPSCYVVTYIATPAETHLPVLKRYYDLSNVVLIEKPLGAPPEQYRAFLDSTDESVQIVAADHYWFKMEVRLLDLLLTEERNLRAFLDEIEEVEIEILEAQAPSGSGAQIGMIADLIPHAFAVLSLLTPLDRLELSRETPLQIGRFDPVSSEHETYARLSGSFDHRGRNVRVTIDVGKGVANAKWIKLTGPRRMGGRRSFYKFDFVDGVAMDGTQGALRAAVRPIRQPGVPDNAHLNMLRHVIEKKHPAIGVLSIHEALRANARVRELERMAGDLLAAGKWVTYTEGQRPQFLAAEPVPLAEIAGDVPITDQVESGLPG